MIQTRSLDLVIVGNGAAAAEAATAICAAGYRGTIDMFADNPYPPYNPMLGPYYVAGAIARERCFQFGDAGFYERRGIRAHLSEPVVGLTPSLRRLTTATGCYTYRACLVASGARTAVPPVPGLDAPGVFTLRSFDDAESLRRAATRAVSRAVGADHPPVALVLGASFAGLKTADALHHVGMHVCIVERQQVVLPLSIQPDCAALIERHLREQGQELLLATTLAAVRPAHGRLVARLTRGGSLGEDQSAADRSLVREADLIVVCTGTQPNLSFLAAGELEVEAGLAVDRHMATTAPGLFAAGDLAQTIDPMTGVGHVVASWATARRQGRVAGRTMAGVPTEDPGCIACNVQRIGDIVFASAGSSADCDRVDLLDEDGGLAALAYRDGRLAGFNMIGGRAAPGPLVCALNRRIDLNAATRAVAAHWARRVTWTSSTAG